MGNYCDVFDCGEYVYAVSNLMHMGLGRFKVVRIDQKMNVVIMYENYCGTEHTQLEYVGRFRNEYGYILIASGTLESDQEDEKRGYQDLTILFQIDTNGNCNKAKEWKTKISSSNSFAVVGDYVYFGHNKMVSKLNIILGEIVYYTNKTDEELAALEKME